VIHVSLELIESLLKDIREDLTREAMRSIRNKDNDRGLSCLAQIEGAERMQRSIERAAQSLTFRAQGHAVVEPSPSRLPVPVSVIRSRRKKAG
jgi:hypothetical protein